MQTTATALPRIMKCDGPITLAAFAASDNRITDSVMEGNAAHKLMQLALKSERDCAEFIGETVNNNYIVTGEMADYIQPHVDIILSHDSLCVEEPTSWTTHNGDIIDGRADFMSFVGNTLHVRDLKYGWRLVEPEENWTLISHAIGFCLKHGYQPDSIVFAIHQPRPWHSRGAIREWVITLDEMQALQNRIRDRLASINNTITTGPHCYKCPVAHVCPSARLAAMNAIDISISSEPEQLDGAMVGYELNLLENAKRALDLRYKAMSLQAEQMLQNGKVVNGYGLDFAYGRKKWKDGIDAATVQMLTGIDVSAPSMLTPPQAKKKGVSEEIIKQLAETPSRGFKLVAMDINEKAKEAFK